MFSLKTHYYWAAKQQISWIIAPWWICVSLWQICITIVWLSGSRKLPAPSSWSERHLHFELIRLCLALLFTISIESPLSTTTASGFQIGSNRMQIHICNEASVIKYTWSPVMAHICCHLLTHLKENSLIQLWLWMKWKTNHNICIKWKKTQCILKQTCIFTWEYW